MVEGVAGSSEKVGVAQRWSDELDNLAFSAPESELAIEDDNATKDTNSGDERIHINSGDERSPHYIQNLEEINVSQDEDQEKFAARIMDLVNPERIEGLGDTSCIQLLLKSKTDLTDLIFIKPLHARINFNCQNHPKANNSKGVILTESFISVDVSSKA